MQMIHLFLLFGPFIAICSYFWACSNVENEEIDKLPRWIYLISIPATFVSIGFALAHAMKWNAIWVVPLFMIPGLSLVLGQIMKVKDNQIQVIQNTLFSTKTSRGTLLRLFTGGGLVPLLHGEVFRESWEEETRECELDVDYMETDDNSPVNVKIIYWLKPDFQNIQQILEVNHDSDKWWRRVETTADGLIKSRASDLIHGESSSNLISSKKDMTTKLSAEKTSDSMYFFQKEADMGFKIVEMMFADIDYTDNVREAHEQITKAGALVSSVKKLMSELGFETKTKKEKNELNQWAVNIIQAQHGKMDRRHTAHDFNINGINSIDNASMESLIAGIGQIIAKFSKKEGDDK